MAGNASRAKRQPLDMAAMVYGVDGARIASCRLRNISVTGAQIEFQRETELPKTFLISFSERGDVRRRCAIVWQFSTVVGVKFTVKDQPI